MKKIIIHLLIGVLFVSISAEAKTITEKFSYAKNSCEKGEGMGCLILGSFYDKGKSVVVNHKKALSLYQKSCQLDDALGCLTTAMKYDKGKGITKDLSQTTFYLEKGCALKSKKACLILGYQYQRYMHTQKEYFEKGVKMLSSQCASSSANFCTALGLLYGSRKDNPNYDKAFESFQRACKGNDAYGCENLGFYYSIGRGAKLDIPEAKEQFQKACDINGKYGCLRLGIMYELGNGVAKDIKKAEMLYKKACDNGSKDACKNLTFFQKKPTK